MRLNAARQGPTMLNTARSPESTVRTSRSRLVLARDISIDEYKRRFEEGEQPLHYAQELERRLGTEIITTWGVDPGLIERLLGRIIGGGSQWHLTRELSRDPVDDFVYLTDETLGFPFLIWNRLQTRKRARSQRIAMCIMDAESVRVRLALRVARLLWAHPVVFTDSASASAIVARCLGLLPQAVAVLPIAIDEDFYSPATLPPRNTRPVIVSAGLEMRDYAVLAEATRELDVDVIVIAESSAMASSPTTRMPREIPQNFAIRNVSTRGLRDLYRQADIVVVTTRPNRIGAGATVAVEALSTGRPLIVTDTPGLRHLIDEAGAIGVPANDADRLTDEIHRLLADPQRASEMGRRGREYVLAHHATGTFVDRLLAFFEQHGLHTPPETPSEDA